MHISLTLIDTGFISNSYIIMIITSAHNPDSFIRNCSSSGGVFSMLAADIIGKSGIIYGAAFDNTWSIKHIRIDSIEGLASLRGSKYAFSEFTHSIGDVLHDLDSGKRVLFCGTPCQIAALRKQTGHNPRLLAVEIICHGTPKPEFWQQYLKELCSQKKRTIADIKRVCFRDKRTGWKDYSFTIEFNDGKVFTQRHDDNLYMRAFSHNLTLRDACFHCPFKYPQGSTADITLGDFWGITQLAPDIDNDLGTTIIIARTTVGENAISFIDCTKSYTIESIAKYNPAITTSACKPSERQHFISETQTTPLIHVLKKYAKRPFSERIYLSLARAKHNIFRIAK